MNTACQRWNPSGVPSWRRLCDGGFHPGRYGAAPVGDGQAKAFVTSLSRRSAVAAVTAAILAFAEYLRDCQSRRGRRRPDSADPHGVVLDFTVAAWRAFIGGVRVGEFDGLGRADWSKTSDSFSNGVCVEVPAYGLGCTAAYR